MHMQLFDIIDTDGSGSVDHDELVSFVDLLAQKCVGRPATVPV